MKTFWKFYFYPRPPGGGRRLRFGVLQREVEISIHALRVEGDLRGLRGQLWAGDDFYPRPPGGGRHRRNYHGHARAPISIHALRVEGDVSLTFLCKRASTFLSTPSGWRATDHLLTFLIIP